MKIISEYKSFNRSKNVDELHYNSSAWMSELDFIDFESNFLKSLVKSYPAKTIIPNLFENIQLFSKEFSDFNLEKESLKKKVKNHIDQLDGMAECDDLSCDSFYVIEHENLAEDIFNYQLRYKNLKIRLFEYLTGIMN